MYRKLKKRRNAWRVKWKKYKLNHELKVSGKKTDKYKFVNISLDKKIFEKLKETD